MVQVIRRAYEATFVTAEESKSMRYSLTYLANFALYESKHLQVGDEDFYIDLLFYHIHLRCFVVIELKKGEFRPEHAGKMSFYLTAIDEQLKDERDHPTIGLILCQGEGNKIVAEYTLRDIHKPVGVASYQLTKSLPEALKDQLPAIEELEEQLQGMPESDEQS